MVFTIVCPDSVIADPPSCWRAGLPVEMVCRQVKLMLKQAVMKSKEGSWLSDGNHRRSYGDILINIMQR